MIKPLLFFLYFLVAASLLFGQVDSNSVTVTGLQTANAQPDQAVIYITVTTGLDGSLDGVIAALQGSGVTAANFNGVTIYPPQYYPQTPDQPMAPTLQWRFTLGAPIVKLKDSLATLTGVQQSLAKQNSGVTLTFYVQGMQFSPQLLQTLSCKLSDAIDDARAKAQKLADAAGLKIGAVLAISGGSAGAGGFFLSDGTVPLPVTPPCSATVKFALLRF